MILSIPSSKTSLHALLLVCFIIFKTKKNYIKFYFNLFQLLFFKSLSVLYVFLWKISKPRKWGKLSRILSALPKTDRAISYDEIEFYSSDSISAGSLKMSTATTTKSLGWADIRYFNLLHLTTKIHFLNSWYYSNTYYRLTDIQMDVLTDIQTYGSTLIGM